jgi:hypothetical protein
MSERIVRRHLLAILSVVSFAALSGCQWQFVRDSGPPSLLRGAGPIVVSFDYSRLIVSGKNEHDFVQERLAKDPAYEKSWSDLKASFETNVVAGVGYEWPPGAQPGPPGPGAHLTVFPTALTMGKYMFVAATATRVDADLNFTVNGQPADQIRGSGAQVPTITTPSVHQHMPAVADAIGRRAGRYVRSKN